MSQTFAERRASSKQITIRYPTRVPCIVQCKDPSFKLEKNKYLIPRSMSVADFSCILRKKLNISKEQALFLLIAGQHFPGHSNMSQIYLNNMAEDGFLYVQLLKEKAFGQAQL